MTAKIEMALRLAAVIAMMAVCFIQAAYPQESTAKSDPKSESVESMQRRYDALDSRHEAMVAAREAKSRIQPQFDDGDRERFREEQRILAEMAALIQIATPGCHASYLATIDKKTSDLTVRGTDTINTCKEMEPQ